MEKLDAHELLNRGQRKITSKFGEVEVVGSSKFFWDKYIDVLVLDTGEIIRLQPTDSTWNEIYIVIDD